jgi:hypothetical protein
MLAPTGLLLACIGVLFVECEMSFEDRSDCEGHDSQNTLNDRRSYQDLRLGAAKRMTEVRRRIARQVLAEKQSLIQAAMRYQDLNEAWEDFCWPGFRKVMPGETDDERACRQVINFVKLEPIDDPHATELCVARLEGELEDLLQKGELHLPR